MTADSSILLIGESGSGKTHYGAQLLGRLNQGVHALRMNGAAPSLAPFEAALKRLNDGLAADHTATDVYLDSEWPMVGGAGRTLSVTWPDYGGEQLRLILEQRRLSPAWRARVTEAGDWVVLVRPRKVVMAQDVFSRPLGALGGIDPGGRDFETSDQARLVELLQVLLHVRGRGTVRTIQDPTLTLLLTCWDELDGDRQNAEPDRVLAEHMPLLWAFAHANWRAGRLRVLGMSALGRALSLTVPDQGFIDEGPERFGFAVDESGRHDPDITLPLARLLDGS